MSAVIIPHFTGGEVGRTLVSSRAMIMHGLFVFKTTTLAPMVCLPHSDVSKSFFSFFPLNSKDIQDQIIEITCSRSHSP